MRRKMLLVIAGFMAAITVTAAGITDLKDLKPGFNLFSPQQDIEVGRAAADEVARQQPIVRNSELNNYLTGLIMAEAGYNPIQMAQLFEKLEAQEGQARSVQFLSDHPNPGNRIKAVQEEILEMPRRSYTTDTRQLARIKDVVARLPAAGQPATPAPNARPSRQSKQYRGRAFTFDYPDNWQMLGDPQAAMVTIAPPDGIVRDRNGKVSIGYGAIVSYYFPQSDEIQMRQDTDKLGIDTEDLIRQTQEANLGMRVGEQRSLKVNGYSALVTTLNTSSPFQGETEIDQLVTVLRPEGLWYLVFISPQSESRDIQPVFEQMLRSVRFTK